MLTPLQRDAVSGKLGFLRAAIVMFSMFFTLSTVWDDAASRLLGSPAESKSRKYRAAIFFALGMTAFSAYQARRQRDDRSTQ